MLKRYDLRDTKLREIWQTMYRNNPYLFPYSSWEYNEIVMRYKRWKPQALLERQYFYVYQDVSHGGAKV